MTTGAEDRPTDAPDWLREGLRAMGLSDGSEALSASPLTGGVASDIWRVDLAGRTLCVKRALERLRVAQEWTVSTERNAFEVAWLETAGAIVPGAVPEVLGHDPHSGLFAMPFLPPDRHPVWKQQLAAGTVEPATAERLGERLAAIHAGTAGSAEIAARFASDGLFAALRIEPYLLATAARHADLESRLGAIAEQTMRTRRALVHGDVSPKNILVGPAGPVLIDAECAWYGDPAFDLAFCLNHLLLKCAWKPAHRRSYIACFESLRTTYLTRVDWEPAATLEGRATALLPALMLARVDGKSPVEYLDEPGAQRVRAFARTILQEGAPDLAHIARRWLEAQDH